MVKYEFFSYVRLRYSLNLFSTEITETAFSPFKNLENFSSLGFTNKSTRVETNGVARGTSFNNSAFSFIIIEYPTFLFFSSFRHRSPCANPQLSPLRQTRVGNFLRALSSRPFHCNRASTIRRL